MKPYYQDNSCTLYQGDVLNVLKSMKSDSVQCVVTSPPYWGLRDYGIDPQVWDEDVNGLFEGCEHVWGDKLSRHSYTSHSGLAQACENYDGRKRNPENNSRMNDTIAFKSSQGQFCQKCNAWRGSLGLEPTPELFIQHMVQVFREVWRVLRKDGTLWLNLGDSYANSSSGGGGPVDIRTDGRNTTPGDKVRGRKQGVNTLAPGLKPKDLCMIPARVALALQADGWYLRSDIIWHKPNPMPESCIDRPTKAHEYLFLLTKSAKYYYDADAIREPHKEPWRGKGETDRVNWNTGGIIGRGHQGEYSNGKREYNPSGRNKRTVWTIPTQPYPEAHFATFPRKLVEPCVKAGSKQGDTVMDPFGGSGTVLYVAKELNRKGIGIELNPEYCEMSIKRLCQEVFNWSTL